MGSKVDLDSATTTYFVREVLQNKIDAPIGNLGSMRGAPQREVTLGNELTHFFQAINETEI